MEELILEYINSYCDVTSRTSVSFNGKKIFHSEITKHLIDLFDIEWSVDDILSDCFKRQDPNFNYYCFMEEKDHHYQVVYYFIWITYIMVRIFHLVNS